MKKNILVLFVLFFGKTGLAQIDSADYKANSFYLFKTEDDFFNDKKVYRGQYLPSDAKVIKYKTLDAKKRKLDLEDSCTYYFGYQIGDEIKIRPSQNPKDHIYHVFGGGTRDTYCVVYGQYPNRDKQGYLLGLMSPGGFIYMYFIDKTHQLNMVQLDELLKSNPKLLEKYLNEKKESEKQAWERNKLSNGIKYLKLFIAENK